MFTTISLVWADESIGRFDKSMLLQQSLMELFIFGIDNVEDIGESRENPTDVCTWDGVWCNAIVEKFDWRCQNAEGTGSLELQFLPSSLKELNMAVNALGANPTKGHLSVVGWTSTPILGEAKSLSPSVYYLCMAPALRMATLRSGGLD
ncbi:hypothetical protein XU18_4786 [Perkinsela sp. CCAP 1560/4]|nr:hypothetical protein XU18_4786 [Perkinsela sp. CCAP 1560/4]|eukprot:KNH03897.1 hypothetical protein XU18_4786 [Perkinsela sp. CCAP 1560/4]